MPRTTWQSGPEPAQSGPEPAQEKPPKLSWRSNHTDSERMFSKPLSIAREEMERQHSCRSLPFTVLLWVVFCATQMGHRQVAPQNAMQLALDGVLRSSVSVASPQAAADAAAAVEDATRAVANATNATARRLLASSASNAITRANAAASKALASVSTLERGSNSGEIDCFMEWDPACALVWSPSSQDRQRAGHYQIWDLERADDGPDGTQITDEEWLQLPSTRANYVILQKDFDGSEAEGEDFDGSEAEGEDEAETLKKMPPGPRTRTILASGALRLLSAVWLITQGDMYIIQRMQDLPEEAFVPPERAAELFDIIGGIVVISYGWLSENHPDPTGFHLRTVQMYLKKHKSGQYEWTNLDDYGVFWDFASLPQDHPDGSKKTAQENQVFDKGLGAMNLLYGDAKTLVIQLTRLPKELQLADANLTEYNIRGWCFFEATVSGVLKDGDYLLDLGAGVTTLDDEGSDWKAVLARARGRAG